MNQKSVVSIALALMLATTGSSFAQGNSGRDRGNNDCPNGKCAGSDQRQRPGQNARQPGRADFQQRQVQPRYDMQQRQYNGVQREERGAGPDRSFYRGQRLPPQYRTRQYVVEDWRGHHLSAPPRGYHWVQSGGDYLLVAITTGIIMQLLLSN